MNISFEQLSTNSLKRDRTYIVLFWNFDCEQQCWGNSFSRCFSMDYGFVYLSNLAYVLMRVEWMLLIKGIEKLSPAKFVSIWLWQPSLWESMPFTITNWYFLLVSWSRYPWIQKWGVWLLQHLGHCAGSQLAHTLRHSLSRFPLIIQCIPFLSSLCFATVVPWTWRCYIVARF